MNNSNTLTMRPLTMKLNTRIRTTTFRRLIHCTTSHSILHDCALAVCRREPNKLSLYPMVRFGRGRPIYTVQRCRATRKYAESADGRGLLLWAPRGVSLRMCEKEPPRVGGATRERGWRLQQSSLRSRIKSSSPGTSRYAGPEIDLLTYRYSL